MRAEGDLSALPSLRLSKWAGDGGSTPCGGGPAELCDGVVHIRCIVHLTPGSGCRSSVVSDCWRDARRDGGGGESPPRRGHGLGIDIKYPPCTYFLSTSIEISPHTRKHNTQYVYTHLCPLLLRRTRICTRLARKVAHHISRPGVSQGDNRGSWWQLHSLSLHERLELRRVVREEEVVGGQAHCI